MTYTLIVEAREAGNPEESRVNNKIPAILYGSERKESVPVAVDNIAFEKLYNQAGESSLIDILAPGEKDPVKVLIQDLQYDPVKGKIIHVDFRQINMNEEMDATIELSFIGESEAVKNFAGTLYTGVDSVSVRCLPKDLISEIEVDISLLTTFDNVIKISDLKIPSGITITDNQDTIVAKVTAPLTEDQFKAMEDSGASSVEDVKVETKGKEDKGADAGSEQEESKEDKSKKSK